jgi:hypothetical protein
VSGEEGTGRRGNWVASALLFPVFTGLGGVLTGFFLGATGSHVPLDTRLALGSLIAPLGVFLGAMDVIRRPLPPLQCDRETPKKWVDEGFLLWPIKNGLALGCGATSRLGFWLWYVIPTGAFLLGSATLGSLIFGSYGLARGMGVWGFILLRVSTDSESFVQWLGSNMSRARAITGAGLVLVCAFSIVAVGLR